VLRYIGQHHLYQAVTARNPTTFLAAPARWRPRSPAASARRVCRCSGSGRGGRLRPCRGSIAGVAAFSSAPPDLLLETEVVILAVRDQVITEVAQMLLGTGMINKRHVLLHCGAASPGPARSGRRAGRRHRTLHPLSAIADGKLSMRALKGTVFGVEGRRRPRHREQAGRRDQRRRARARQHADAAYHAAAAMASNYVVALLDAAAAVLATVGVPQDRARRRCAAREGALRNIAAHARTGGLTDQCAAVTSPPSRATSRRSASGPSLPRSIECLRGAPSTSPHASTAPTRRIARASMASVALLG